MIKFYVNFVNDKVLCEYENDKVLCELVNDNFYVN